MGHRNKLFCLQYWKDCRWMDPWSSKDLDKMKERLSMAQSAHAFLQTCRLSMLLEVLAIVRDSSTQCFNNEEGECSGSSGEGSDYHSVRDLCSPPGTPASFSSQPTLPSLALRLDEAPTVDLRSQHRQHLVIIARAPIPIPLR